MTAGRHPAAALPPRPGAPECRFCGAPLTAHQAVRGVCAAPACVTRRVQEASRLVFQRSWQDHVDRQRLGIEAAAAQVASAAHQLGEAPEAIAFGVVPHQDGTVTELPEERRADFIRHLDRIIADAFAAGEPPQPDLNRREIDEQSENPLIGATCATCQGRCCLLGGGTHAFLTAETIQLYRWRNPAATPGEVSAHYLSHLPKRTVEHSCVYHGARGCTLSRQARADVCNRYHCNPQSDLLRRFRAMGAKSAVIVAHDDDAGPAVGVFDASGWRRHAAADRDNNGGVNGGTDADPGAGPDTCGVSLEMIGRTVAAAIAQLPPDLPGERPSAPAEPVCAWCGAPTDRHKAVTRRSCGTPACERRRLAGITAEFERGKALRHAALVRRMRDAHMAGIGRAADALGVAPESIAVGVVPAVEAPLETLPAARRAAFEAHLDKIVAEGFAAAPQAVGVLPCDDGRAAPEPALVTSACTVCAGGCCRGGGELAYLTADDVMRLRRSDPAKTPEKARAFYLDLLPDVSVRGSCVYHGGGGCSLPRQARSDTCNGFRCRGLGALLAEGGETGPRAAVIVAADDKEAPRRAVVFDEAAGVSPLRMPGRGADREIA